MIAPLARFRALLAASTAFQTAVGAEDADEAAAKVVYFGKRDPDGLPRAYIRADGETHTRTAAESFRASGTIGFEIDLARPDEATWDEEYEAILTTVAAIASDIRTIAKQTGTLDISVLTLDAPVLTENGRKLQFWTVTGSLQWPSPRS